MRGALRGVRLRPWALPGGSVPAWASLTPGSGICSSSAALAARQGAGSTPPPPMPDDPLAPAAPLDGGSSTAGEATGVDRLAKVVAKAFHDAPKDMASAVIKELGELDRIHLVLALQRQAKRVQKEKERAFVDDLHKKVLQSPDDHQHSKLTRQQIQGAVMYQRMLQRLEHVSEEQPSLRQLAAVAFASGLPFCCFGFLDNSLMLVAGEQIDHLFGAKMGLTVMASAALGNLVADVVGVSATHTVQENIKRVNWARQPKLSELQKRYRSVKLAQFFGAATGVAVGCVLGMAPLLFMEPGFFVKATEAAAAAGDAAAAAATHVDAAMTAAAAAALAGAGGAAEGAGAADPAAVDAAATAANTAAAALAQQPSLADAAAVAAAAAPPLGEAAVNHAPP